MTSCISKGVNLLEDRYLALRLAMVLTTVEDSIKVCVQQEWGYHSVLTFKCPGSGTVSFLIEEQALEIVQRKSSLLTGQIWSQETHHFNLSQQTMELESDYDTAKLRELSNRRRVSNLLQNGFGLRLDELLRSHVERQEQASQSEQQESVFENDGVSPGCFRAQKGLSLRHQPSYSFRELLRIGHGRLQEQMNSCQSTGDLLKMQQNELQAQCNKRFGVDVGATYAQIEPEDKLVVRNQNNEADNGDDKITRVSVGSVNIIHEANKQGALHDLVAAGQVRVLHVPSRYQYADSFTKGLPSALFEEFRTSLRVRCPPAPTAGEC
ncbi:hypothetical protein Tco_1427730 [Tanacetum coccineum]